MSEHNDSKFSVGFILGLVLGGGLVFLFGTKTGRNLLKIVSEQGLDGIINLLEQYNWDDLAEYEEVDVDEADVAENNEQNDSNEKNKSPKKRFFKRIRR